MARPVILGNSSLTVGLNEKGLVQDFYYPYVGLENLTTARSVHHKIGIFVDNSFSWVEEAGWDISVTFENDALVSIVRMQHEELQVELLLQDFVDSGYNAFCRRITVTNQSGTEREIRLFLHQVFQISRDGRADTAFFVPDENYILDYKGRCSLLVYGQTSNKQAFDQFAVGSYGIEGKEGTFKDAEDGELSGSAVEHGGVDSVIRFSMKLQPKAHETVDYWIVAADSQLNCEKIHSLLLNEGLEQRLATTRHYWNMWLSIGSNKLHAVEAKYLNITKKSLMIIKAHVDKRGGIIASCDSSIYNYGRDYYSYVWPRDGAYAIWPLIRLGYTDEPKKFFEFCRDILTPEGYLMHKYQPDRAIGSTWHPMLHGKRKELAIQEDETASVLYMLGEFLEYTDDTEFVESLYETLICPAANFLQSFIDAETGLPHASYDLWEEKFGTHTYTTGVTYQALLVAAEFAELFGRPDDASKWELAAESLLKNRDMFYDTDLGIYRKSVFLADDKSITFDNTLDVSSLYGIVMFGYHDGDLEKILSTQNRIEDKLSDISPSGGVPRYEHDNYFAKDPPFMGNPWLVTTLWMAQFYSRAKNDQKAKAYVDWAISKCLPSGVLAEQINPTDSSPVSVAPLVWSHAELINTILDISK